MQVERDFSLGEFGDVRLDKRGRRFSAPCFASVVRVCARWRKGSGLPRWPFGGS
jgi:hypothetical protein